ALAHLPAVRRGPGQGADHSPARRPISAGRFLDLAAVAPPGAAPPAGPAGRRRPAGPVTAGGRPVVSPGAGGGADAPDPNRGTPGGPPPAADVRQIAAPGRAAGTGCAGSSPAAATAAADDSEARGGSRARGGRRARPLHRASRAV